MTLRFDVFRPVAGMPTLYGAFTEPAHDADFRRRMIEGCPPGTFALIIGIADGEAAVLERWRVSADGRILRAVYDVRERELEQT